MATTTKDPVVVVLQMTGANDYLNTIIPYTNEHYYDARPKVGIPADQVLPIDDQIGFNPNMGPIKKLWDDGKMAIIHGIGYENSPRSHFRSMDILAHLRAGHRRHRGLGRPRDSGPGPQGRERLEGRQLRAGSAARIGFARRTGDLRFEPGVLRRAVQRAGRLRRRGSQPDP